MSGGEFDWGGRLRKGIGGAQRFPQNGRPVCATWNRHRLGIFSGSVISDAGGSVLTGKAAEGGAAACGGTGHQAGIAAGEVVAAHVTDDVQPT